ncbi:FAD binding domain-containing protein [Pseudomonadota bacterium]|jgi:carbon-monoxide dehydrogenase medium subunit|nr:FAD binding domain-containing protein [Pseudomonadota bacterium]|tara:strand:+ start:280 stop:1122 length:843 start_codon:yes stop_codon:yes gene_type:complete
MKSPDFGYYEASSIEDAIKFKSADDESVFLAGGQSLIPALNMRLSTPSCLIDISKINELKNISIDDHFISIGASVTHSEVLQNKIILEYLPTLTNVLKMVAHPAIRNKGTHGGSIAYGDPAAELPAFAVALNAEITLVGLKGTRTVSANDFYYGLFETEIKDDEILTNIKYPLLKSNQKIIFDEIYRRHGDYAMAGLIANIEILHSKIDNLKLVFFATGIKPEVAIKTSNFIIKDGYNYSKIKDILKTELDLDADLNSSSEMKLHLATILTKRILKLLEI